MLATAAGARMARHHRLRIDGYLLRGPESALRPLTAPGPGTRLRIIGQWVGGSRDSQVASIELGRTDERSGGECDARTTRVTATSARHGLLLALTCQSASTHLARELLANLRR